MQAAKHFGATVTAVTSARNEDFVRELGPDHVIDYQLQDFATLGRNYDLVIDCVGNAPFSRAMRCLEPGGTLVLVAVSGLQDILLARRNSRRSSIDVIPINFKASKADVRFALELFEAGTLRPVRGTTYRLEEIQRAHAHVDEGRKRGAAVLVLE